MKKCKHSILTLHSKKTEITQTVYRSGSKPKCVAEKRLVYETLALLNTVVYISGRTFTHAFVYAVKSLVTTNIVNKIIENNIHMCKDQEDDAFTLLSSIGQILNEVELAVKAMGKCGVNKDALDEDVDVIDEDINQRTKSNEERDTISVFAEI